MTSPGRVLKHARESTDRQLADIAAKLCISETYLIAIEEDDLVKLPGTFFYRNFARQYAEFLGVDAVVFRAALDGVSPARETQSAQADGKQRESEGSAGGLLQLGDSGRLLVGFASNGQEADSNPPIRRHDQWVTETNRNHFSDQQIGFWVAALAAVLIACTGFYGWWNRPKQISSAVTTVAPPPVEATPAQPVIPAVSTPEAPVAVKATADGDGVIELRVSATEKTWLSISSSDGKVIYAGVLQPSQTKTLSGIEAAKIRVGNAGGIDVQWKGKPVGPIGPRGQVRIVLLNPDNVEILPPPPISSTL